VFKESSFQVWSFSWSGKKNAEYRYEDVLAVKRGQMRGGMDVVLSGSTPLHLTPLMYEDKEKRFFSEFEMRLPSGKMEPDLKASILKYKKYDKIMLPIYFAMIAGVSLVKSKLGWPDVVPWNLGTNYRIISVQDNGAVWFATWILTSNDTRIGLMQGESAKYWELPAKAYPGSDSSFNILGVSGNAKGNPVVIFESYVLSWDGEEWENLSIPAGIMSYVGYSVSNYSLEFFSAEESGYLFWSCEINRVECRQLPVPDALNESNTHPIAYHGSASGPIVAVANPDGPVSFFRFQQGGWSMIGEPIAIPAKDLLAFAVSGDGTIWVTRDLSPSSSWDRSTKGPLAFGRWDGARKEWLWGALDAYPGSFQQRVEYMEVDSRGRIWIAGHFETNDIGIGGTASAYVIQGETAAEIVRYTDDNSNFQIGIGGCGLVQAPDGMLWSCDSGLISLDSSAEKLPTPIPAWLSDLGLHKYQMIGIGMVCGLEIVYFGVLGLLYLRRRKSDQAAGTP
jgi:hypothetical protein